jgi:chitinase
MPLCGTNLRSSCADVNSHNKIVVCYVNSWAAKRSGNGKFLVENIDPLLCTHIIYAFAGLDNVNHSIQSRHSDIDLEEGGGRGNNKFKDSKYAQLLILN